MKKDELKNIVIFIILIIAIILLLLFNGFRNKKVKIDDRKIVKINNMTYNEVFNKTKELFSDTMDILVNNKFEYEKNSNGKDKIYSFNGKDYKKITNISIILSKISENSIDKFMEYKNIIKKDNNYYILNNSSINTTYIGSNITINEYSNEYVIINSINYYSDTDSYQGLIEDDINCKNKGESTFKITFKNNNIVIDNIDELINIIKKIY